MGTGLDNVLEDINELEEHLKYFATCKGNKTINTDIEVIIAQLKNLANRINKE
jgi:hypothetical protein